MVRLRSFPRLHFALIDLGRTTRRTYGGIGASLSGPYTELVVSHDEDILVVGQSYLDDRGLHELKSAAGRLLRSIRKSGVRIEIIKALPQHAGFGSKTALLLGALQATANLYSAPLSRSELQKLSARGGTSGVGIHTFFRGGVVVDAGHPSEAVKQLGPSSMACPVSVPPLLTWLSFPSKWCVYLLLPLSLSQYSGRLEVEFFEAHTPIPDVEVLSTMASVYHGVCAAILEQDLSALSESLRDLHSFGFKRRELMLNSGVEPVLQLLWRIPGCASGMSSLGPLLYSIASKQDEAVADRVKEVAVSRGWQYLGRFYGRNTGFEVVES